MLHVCALTAPGAVASCSAGSQPCTSQLRLSYPGTHVHAAPLGVSKRPFGIAARTSAFSSERRGFGVDDESIVEAIAVIERPGAVPDTHFQQHDHAVQLCEQLQAFNQELGFAIDEADTVLEISEWDTLTLPPDVKEKFTGVYRETRKEQNRHEKEERRLRREQRIQQKAARMTQQQQPQLTRDDIAPEAPAVQQVVVMPLQQQQPVPQQLSQAESVSSQSSSAAAPSRQRRGAVQQQQQLLTQQQPPQRTRRQRSSIAGPVVPAAISNTITTSSSTSSTTSSISQSAVATSPAAARSRSVASAASASPATSAAPVAPVAGSSSSKAPKQQAARTATTTSALPAHNTSSSAIAVPAVQQPAAAVGFAPLAVLQQQRVAMAPVRSASGGAASSRRANRAAGVGRRGSTTTGAAAGAAVSAPSQALKLSENTMHGLDMRAELLTADQEKDLAVMVQDLLALEGLAEDLAVQLGRPPSDLEWMEAAGAGGTTGDVQLAVSAFQARLHAGRSAKQVMIKANYKLVVSICRKYQGHGLSMGDLINEGIAGLVKGVERFEPAKGFKFSTYAHWWIRQGVSRSLADQGRLVRLPIHMQELLGKATKASKAFEAKHGREPTAEELAPELGVDASRIQDAWDAVISPRSLDQPMGGEADGGTLGDVLEDDRTIGSEEAVYIESLKQDLEGVLAGLSERDAGVLRMRFGLTDGKEYTLDEVGAEFRVTRERIRQIEAKAIRQLRAHHISPGSVMADYQTGAMADKALAARTSSGTKKQK